MARKKSEVDAIRNVSKKEIKENPVEFFNSGSTMLNLALSGKGKKGGWARGRIINIVGDGSSGKTALALEACAEALYRLMKTKSNLFPDIKQVRIRYNNVEAVMDFPLVEMYGEKFVDEVEWISTRTVEEFGADFTRECLGWKPGIALIYVVDSWDALTSKAGQKRFEDAAFSDGDVDSEKAKKGTYGAGPEKAKYASSEFFNNICGMMEGKDISLFIISQLRQKINAMMFEKKTYRTGGKALDFYTHQVAWLAEIQKLDRTVRGHKMIYGITSRAKIERNKTAKPFRQAEFTILFDYGLDDLSSMIDWYWGPKVKKIKFDGEEFSRQDFIHYVEDNDLIDVVRELVEEEWIELEKEIAPDRKPKFGDE